MLDRSTVFLDASQVMKPILASCALALVSCDRAPVTASLPEAVVQAPCADGQKALLNREVEFEISGQRKRATLNDLRHSLGEASEVSSKDPYYSANMMYRGWRAGDVLAKFGVDATEADLEAIFKASDGYEIHLPVHVLREGSAWLVYANSKGAPLPSIGPRGQDPGPLYLIWEGEESTNLTTHPRPYSIVEVHVQKQPGKMTWLPMGTETAELLAGEASFRTRCVRCHAMNQRGGRVGPDLNVPQNILAYRAEAQVRAYIVNPAAFRYGTMPSHPDLLEPELTQLIAFLRVMGQHQQDSSAVRDAGH